MVWCAGYNILAILQKMDAPLSKKLAAVHCTNTPYSTTVKQRQLDGSLKSIEIRHFKYENQNVSINDIEVLSRNLQKKLETAKRKASIQLIIQCADGAHVSGKYRDIPEDDIELWNPHLHDYSALDDGKSEQQKWYDEGRVVPECFWFNVIFTDGQGGVDNENND